MAKNTPKTPAPAADAAAVAQVIKAAEAAVEASAAKTVHNKKLEILGEIKPEAKITWLVTENPRSKGRATYDRFQAYLGTPSVADYLAAGGTRGDLNWDLRAGYLTIENVELGGEVAVRKTPVRAAKPAAEPKAPKVKKEKVAKPAPEVDAAVQEETID